MSLLHRATGIIIAFGALIIAWWIWSISSGGSGFDFVRGFLSSAVGHIFLLIWTLCTTYHLLNGIRHLIWDAGYGYEIREAYFMGKIVLGLTLAINFLVWIL